MAMEPVVLAGAVVCKDVPPYAVVGGVPAKVINIDMMKKQLRFAIYHVVEQFSRMV